MSVRLPFSVAFPKPHVVGPISDHKYTILALHGLGSTGEIFAEKLKISKPKLFPQSAPTPTYSRWLEKIQTQNIRFVFPTAPVRTVKAFSPTRAAPAWFSISSFTDLEVNQDEQMSGLRESITYISDIVEDETALLRRQGRTDRDLFVLARSQGSSVAGWLLMTRLKRVIGGMVLAGSWLVLARALLQTSREQSGADKVDRLDLDAPVPSSALNFAHEMLQHRPTSDVMSTIPILMGHSIDDKWIDIRLGRQFRDILTATGGQVQWRDYELADEDGHWFKEPEEFEAIAEFWLKYMRL